MNKQKLLPSEKFLLTFEEAAKYFHIGENKLRALANDNPKWVIANGSHKLIKRVLFEEAILKAWSI